MLIVHEDGNVKSINFCCENLAVAIIRERYIQALSWTDHAPRFVIERNGSTPLPIKCCPFCGAAIKDTQP